MLWTLICVPAVAAGVAFLLPDDRWRRALLLGVSVLHLGLTLSLWPTRPAPALHGWLALDALGLIFLTIISGLFLAASIYALGYLGPVKQAANRAREEGLAFNPEPEAVFIGCLLLFLTTMTVVSLSQHFGLLWVAVEATTLASAPLIYFHRDDRSLEATWKYLLLCSVGIAVALLGNFFLAVSASGSQGSAGLSVPDLIRHAAELHPDWLKAAFILLLVGYGTKMGLAPMHTWLPDAHSESPSLVSALLSGALLNCAFLGILRCQQVCSAAGLAAFGQSALVVLGLFSMGIAAVFILGQADYKRLLAYSSVEHMGILALGIGVGGAGIFGSIFHAVNHSLAKGMLFLAAGNILSAYRTKSAHQVRGLWQNLPITGSLWLAGFLAITGTPPFGSFFSEFTILKAAWASGQQAVAIIYLIFLAVAFIGLLSVMLPMVQGEAPEAGAPVPESWLTYAPAAVLGVLALTLGIYLPPFFSRVLHEAAVLLGGS